MRKVEVERLLAEQAKRGNHNAAVLLALRRDPSVARAHRIAIHGRCQDGCSFWQCGREAGHAGPCQP